MSKSERSTVEEYILSYPADVQIILKQLQKIIREMIPNVEESIRYDMPTFSYNGKYIIYFAAWKKHISLYPFTEYMETVLKEADAYKISGKGTIQFPLNEPLPEQLIKKIIDIRLKEREV